ncbi:MAG: DUF29 domain-containing protein [Cyanobacteria bacterium QH_8_48_120]|nr:MAG: DUF29 domain-containing protein [Cyanobacteria bacterium QH_1_48_107]PSO71862.1 MAG: DUF29 domain-containing protein [Cyanobacteria bacterium QH_8_48_120]
MRSILYEQDYYIWLQKTAQLLRNGNLSELDTSHLVEEIEDMGRSQKQAFESNLVVVLKHMLTYKYQPEMRYGSWKFSIREHRRRLRKQFKDSPSFKPYFSEMFEECYVEAKAQASDETGLAVDIFPEQSPFPPEQTLDSDYLPG